MCPLRSWLVVRSTLRCWVLSEAIVECEIPWLRLSEGISKETPLHGLTARMGSDRLEEEQRTTVPTSNHPHTINSALP